MNTQISLYSAIPIGCLSFLGKAVFNYVDIRNNSLQHLSPSLRWFETLKKITDFFSSFYLGSFLSTLRVCTFYLLVPPHDCRKILKTHELVFEIYPHSVSVPNWVKIGWFVPQKCNLEKSLLFINTTPLSFKSLKKL